ncbi:hypothetical protein DBV15_07156 [Temnothorax longispinosus]|uniref:Uncharacterized protein n=1 Tax=Temnothorax longispinosus TaxID=300112 RepID=A0A4S2KK07_9HYME|nr:hypothetical protein DBV15_07156 [Temnothorax longispinosus]
MHLSALLFLIVTCALAHSAVGITEIVDSDSVYFPDQTDYIKLATKCKDNMILWPGTRRCYKEGEQGPCNVGRVLVFDRRLLKPGGGFLLVPMQYLRVQCDIDSQFDMAVDNMERRGMIWSYECWPWRGRFEISRAAHPTFPLTTLPLSFAREICPTTNKIERGYIVPPRAEINLQPCANYERLSVALVTRLPLPFPHSPAIRHCNFATSTFKSDGRTGVAIFAPRATAIPVSHSPVRRNARYLVVSVRVGAYRVRKWMMAEEIEIRADKKRMKVEGKDHPKHLMVVSCRENEESATEFPPLSQIPASLASRRRRRRWNVKSGSTTAVVTNDRSRGQSGFLLPCKPLQRLKHRGCEDIPRFEVWIESDTSARRPLHSSFAFVGCL